MSTAKPSAASLFAMPILAGLTPQMSVRNNTAGNSAISSGRKKKASAAMPGISTLVSIISLLVDYGVPVTRLVDSGAMKSTFYQLAPNHPVEIAVCDQGTHAHLT